MISKPWLSVYFWISAYINLHNAVFYMTQYSSTCRRSRDQVLVCCAVVVVFVDAYLRLHHGENLKPWHMGTHLKVLSESYPMNTNMTRSRWFSKFFTFCTKDDGSLSNGRVKILLKHLLSRFQSVTATGAAMDVMLSKYQKMTLD